jgi:G8 domain
MMFRLSYTVPTAYCILASIASALINDFLPLSCNRQLSTAPCVSWIATYGSNNSFTTTVQIDCGNCVLMDHPGPDITFFQGIDIIGKVVFSNDAPQDPITIYTTSITVQGELDLQSTSTSVTGTPNIHIIMTGKRDKQAFRPVGENIGACSMYDFSGNCPVGRKAITVAGGKVTSTYLSAYSKLIASLLQPLIFTSNDEQCAVFQPTPLHG